MYPAPPSSSELRLLKVQFSISKFALSSRSIYIAPPSSVECELINFELVILLSPTQFSK
ncbi:hypothetical protein [Methanobrevibacter sp. 87.7]|uniref:hypothetical protein n=1 Tax=Methanobrevibacter sp. 87.7 TaxID=387957 RepID=UPI001303C511|nr:hypothetical protein [Methanobrevibacter sp. 87.7]